MATHGLAIAAALTLNFPAGAPPKSTRPIYDELIKPHEHEILYYNFRRKPPEVVPAKRVGTTPDPQGAELSRDAIIATSPKPKSKQVFISVPVPKIEIHQDLPTPLLVARLETQLPPPPPKPQPKKFVPPPPSKQEPKLPIPTPVLDSQAPAMEAGVNAPVRPSTLNFSMFNGPPPKPPEASTARTGNAPADIAAASLHPSPDADGRVPNGDRPGNFSKAPTQGPPASGDGVNGALTVADLTVRSARPEPAVAPAIPVRPTLYAEKIRSVPLSTLSVPLRPASRLIPQSVDARFPGRNVYTIVIPMENMPSYAGDWIMWFADRQTKPGETPVVRAPVPYRKLEPQDQPQADKSGQRVQFAATLGRDGKLDGITLLTGATAAVQRAVFQDVTTWEFQPATRDGSPVDVDVVLEIPFNMATALARSTPP